MEDQKKLFQELRAEARDLARTAVSGSAALAGQIADTRRMIDETYRLIRQAQSVIDDGPQIGA